MRLLSGDPSQDVHHFGIRQTEEARNDFQKRVRGQILEVIDVRLDLHPILPAGCFVVFVKRQLQVGFAELDLLPAPGRSRMQKARTDLDRKSVV